jgi:hypothetical protein
VTHARHFLDLDRFDAGALRAILDRASTLKAELKSGRDPSRPLAGRTLALIFEKPSTRTRVSFEVGMKQLGGDVVVLTKADMQSSRGETMADTARVLSRYVDAIMIRTDDAGRLAEMAEHATVPVINGLTARSPARSSPGPATATTSPRAGCRRRCSSGSSFASPVPRGSSRRRRSSAGRGSAAGRSRSPPIRSRRWRGRIAWSPTPGCR